MRYYSSAFPVLASTNGVAYELYLAGCAGYCEGCHSPHTWNKNLGTEITPEFLNKIIMDIKKNYSRGLIDNICILGGEPLDNTEDELVNLISRLRSEFPKCEIYLYTHFELSEIEDKFSRVLRLLDYIKTGKFQKDLYLESGFKDPITGVMLATSNQKFYKLRESR